MSENPALSRRTIVKGAAWSVPVIAAAVAVPMSAASGVVPRAIGPLVESSDNIKDGSAAMSAVWMETKDCATEPNGQYYPWNLKANFTATLTYNGANPDFTLAGSTVLGGVWSISSATKNQLTLVSTQNITCQVGIQGFNVDYNLPPEVKPELRSLTLNVTGSGDDGKLQITGLISVRPDNYRQPVVGPITHNA
ncbi:hypothetical protein PTQ19_09265 [Microbacterium esteraromaticum]|uniref:hypothetical protein n=1 Tax=Microbacterium esteraromaticum TaxID=57043 RepID=UPI0023688A18|nr:hypothetical protein [Microbacterium esteraromaticum]WDH77714.1 hypothetical protein PTQ19_09265 [Microbacterium esteraromaticum]